MAFTSTGRPLSDDARHLDEYIFLALARALEGGEAVVGGVQRMQCRAFAEFLADGLEKVQVRQLVARAAEEEHRHRDRAEVVRTLGLRLAGLMQGEGEEDQAVHAVEGG